METPELIQEPNVVACFAVPSAQVALAFVPLLATCYIAMAAA